MKYSLLDGGVNLFILKNASAGYVHFFLCEIVYLGKNSKLNTTIKDRREMINLVSKHYLKIQFYFKLND